MFLIKIIVYYTITDDWGKYSNRLIVRCVDAKIVR